MHTLDQNEIRWKRFIRNNWLVYVITNVGFNFLISYSSFISAGAGNLHLFSGSQCIARFLLPLAFFVPLVISVDVTNRLRKFDTRYELKIALFKKKGYQKKFFIHSLKYGLVAGCSASGIMGALQLFVSDTYAFPPLWTSMVIAWTAGFLASFFMLRTVKLHGFTWQSAPHNDEEALRYSMKEPGESSSISGYTNCDYFRPSVMDEDVH